MKHVIYIVEVFDALNTRTSIYAFKKNDDAIKFLKFINAQKDVKSMMVEMLPLFESFEESRSFNKPISPEFYFEENK